MAFIRIPRSAFAGFRALLRLDDNKVDEFTQFLTTMPIGTTPRVIDDFLSNQLGSKNSAEIVHTMLSFSDLLSPEDIDYKDLADNLASSFNALSDSNLTEEEIATLASKLLKIISNSKSLKFTLKAFDLIRDDDYIYKEARIFSDIRLMFNDKIEDDQRNALLIHHLVLDYFKDEQLKKISFILDIRDLKILKGIIDRAISKDEVIKSDYRHITFLNLSEDAKG